MTVLVENTSNCASYGAEHGLSLYIETEQHNILFDMGQSDLFLENAKKLSIDLAAVDVAIVSHGHYDHGGGLGRFLEINQNVPIYVNQYAFEPHYNKDGKYIGLDLALKGHERIILTDGICEIGTGLTLDSAKDRETAFDLGTSDLTMEEHGQILPEDFRHEQYLLIEEQGMRVLLSGCSHNGILNITNWFRPDVLVGGFHFSKLPLDDTLKGYATYLNQFETDFYTCHCTGVEQTAFMKQQMHRLQSLSTGDCIEI